MDLTQEMRHALAGGSAQCKPACAIPACHVTDSNTANLIEVSSNKQPAFGVERHFVNPGRGSSAKALHPVAQRQPIGTVPFHNSVGGNTVNLSEISTDVQVGAVRKQVPHCLVRAGSNGGPGASIPLCQISDCQARVSEIAAEYQVVHERDS